jgi:hypothetical protein
MPAPDSNIISFILSGGGFNSNPLLSLGGEPSAYPVVGNINGLFSDIPEAVAKSGSTDYRCIYIANADESSLLVDASIYLDLPDYGESDVMVGLIRSSESQVVSVTGPVFFGAVTFSFDGTEFSASWGESADDFATNLVSGFDSIGVEGVSVSVSFLGNSQKFNIVFGGANENKAQHLLQVSANMLEGVSTPSVSASRQTAGLPINSTASQIATPETPPARVEFMKASSSSRILVGTLAPGDSFPVWLRRTTPRLSASKQGANFFLRVSGTKVEA